MELRLRLYQKLILFDVTNIRDSDVILKFSWLETTEPLIFWAQRTVVLRRTGMPGAVIVRISTREYDSRVLQNINNNRRSTSLIPYITKY